MCILPELFKRTWHYIKLLCCFVFICIVWTEIVELPETFIRMWTTEAVKLALRPVQTPYEANCCSCCCYSYIFSFLSGMNSILVYVGSEILGRYFPFSWTVSGHKQHADQLAMNILGTTVWLIIAYYLYCIKFFVKI